LNEATGPDPLAHDADDLQNDLVTSAVDARQQQHEQSQRQLALQRVCCADDRAFRDVPVIYW
jgi:hypothetical protein